MNPQDTIATNAYATSSGGTQMHKGGAYSDAIARNTYKDNSPYSDGNNSPYSGNNSPFETGKNPYAKTEEVYKNNGEVLRPRYKRFNDLKILNEQMMALSNNNLPENTNISILSQGQKGEIKNLLMPRILKVGFMPALFGFLLVITVILTEHLMATLFMFSVYLYVIGRTFYYPAKLFYENVQFETNEAAKLYFEEMEFWFKLSVVKTLVTMFILIVSTMILIFCENLAIEMILSFTNTQSAISENLKYLASTISFSYTLVFLLIIFVFTLVLYFKFINHEKEKNLIIRDEKLKQIRNEVISTVEQIQLDKNE